MGPAGALTRLARAELQKLRTVWSTYVILGVTLAAAVLLGLAVGLGPHRRAGGLFPARGSANWFADVFSAMTLSQDLALVLGVLVVTGEYRHHTITSTYLTEPRRGRVVSAKLVVAALAGMVVALVGGAGSLGLGAVLVAVGDGPGARMLTEFGHVFPGVLAATVLFACYGVGLGSLLRNQVVALVVGLGVSAVVEPIIVGVWPSVGRWLPSQAAVALHSVSRSAAAGGLGASSHVHLLSAWAGALVLLGYGVALAAVGARTTLRSDVT